MIRINLIAEGRRPVAAKTPRLTGLKPAGDPALWWLAGLVLLGALVAGGHLLLLNSRVSTKQQQVAEAQKEVDELAPFIQEVEEFKAKKAELERKVSVINDLKANQHGPVRIMDEGSRALPELLWLNRLEVSATTITVAGEAFNTNAVANFIENLDRVPEFQEPILRDTAQQEQIYTFVIAFNYSYAAPPAAEAGEDPAVPAGG